MNFKHLLTNQAFRNGYELIISLLFFVLKVRTSIIVSQFLLVFLDKMTKITTKSSSNTLTLNEKFTSLILVSTSHGKVKFFKSYF